MVVPLEIAIKKRAVLAGAALRCLFMGGIIIQLNAMMFI
jgi:hypothetical protein